MSFEIGANVGPYQILEQLGQGGMATVYKAYHPALDRYVAIKVLHSAFLEDESFLARFKREAKVVAQLDHPNIVPIYDFAEEKKQPYLVMKYIEGETLKARLKAGKIKTPEIVQIAEKVGAALSYAHKKQIVHRDVKPSNVLFSKEGQAYLADFGLARIAQGSASTLTSEQMIGTPQYISPEQALSQSDLDYHTDIYSLGVMLYELFVGKVPFNADTPFAIVHDHIYTPLPLPRKINPEVTEDIERVLLKAMAKKPGDRYDSVDALIRALKAAAGIEKDKLDQEETTRVSAPLSSSSGAEMADVPPIMPPPPFVPGKSSTRPDQEKDSSSHDHPATTRKSKKAVAWILGTIGSLIICFLIFVVARRWLQNLQQGVIEAAPIIEAQIEALPTVFPEDPLWQEKAAQALDAYNNGSLEAYLRSLPNLEEAWFNRDGVNQKAVFNYFFEKQAFVLACIVIRNPSTAFLETDPFLDPRVHEAFYKASNRDSPNADLLFNENLDTLSIPSEVGLIRYNYLRGKFASADEAIQVLRAIKDDPLRYKNYPEVDFFMVEIYEKNAPEKVDPLLNEILLDRLNIYDKWIEELAKQKTNL